VFRFGFGFGVVFYGRLDEETERLYSILAGENVVIFERTRTGVETWFLEKGRSIFASHAYPFLKHLESYIP
jgi:hypothetical protein